MDKDTNMLLMIIFGIYLGVLTFHLIVKAKQSEERRRIFFLSIAVFSGFYFITRILLTINYLAGWDKYSDLYVLATFFVLIGFAALIFSVEKFIFTRLKFLPTLCVLVFAALCLIYPRTASGTNMVTTWSIIGGAVGVLVPFLYLYVGLKSAGALRKNSLIIALGTILFMVGKVLNTGSLQEAVAVLYLIAPILMIIGLLIFHYGIIKPFF